MGRTTRRVIVLAAAIALVVSVDNAGGNSASTDVADHADDSVTSTETVAALSGVPGVLEESVKAPLSGDAASAIVTERSGVAVKVARDPEAGVDLDVAGGSVNVGLPGAAGTSTGRVVDDGVVAYEGSEGFSNSVQVTEDGGVRLLTTIANAEAPTAYDYAVDVPDGAHLTLTDDGGAAVVDEKGDQVLAAPAPWAKDAEGRDIPTRFEVSDDGSALTQVVDHTTTAGVSYPVVADPIWFAIAPAIFWWAVTRCGAGGMFGAISAYLGGSRSAWAVGAQGAVGCISTFIGGVGVLRQMIRVVRW